MMAYLDFGDAAPAGVAMAVAAVSQDEGDATFGHREWQVVALARGDRMSSVMPAARFARLRTVLFGLRADARLADPRLEALRRVAVHAWHYGHAIPEREVAAFLGAGYDARQLEMLVTRIDALRR